MRLLDSRSGYQTARRFFSGTQSVQREEAIFGDEGEQQLVDKIQAAIAEAGQDLDLRNFVLRVVRGQPGNDIRSQVRAWFDFVKDDTQVPYRRDPVNMQLIASAMAVLTGNGGDCKWKTILIGGGLESIGVETRVVTVDQHKPDDPSPVDRHHVYLEWLTDDGQWEPLDAVLTLRDPAAAPGDELPWRSKALFSDPRDG